jgi:hypothetical protein
MSATRDAWTPPSLYGIETRGAHNVAELSHVSLSQTTPGIGLQPNRVCCRSWCECNQVCVVACGSQSRASHLRETQDATPMRVNYANSIEEAVSSPRMPSLS